MGSEEGNAVPDAVETTNRPRRSSRKRNVVSYSPISNNSSLSVDEALAAAVEAVENDNATARAKKKAPKTATGSAKRNATKKPAKGKSVIVDLTAHDNAHEVAAVKAPARKRTKHIETMLGQKATIQAGADGETRQKEFRDIAPQKFQVTRLRATTQRMFAMDRSRAVKPCSHPSGDCPMETVDMAGSTGNVYTVTISHIPKCTCMNFRMGNAQCKHIIYVLVKVLKTPEHLQYQLAFLSSELREIFNRAGPVPVDAHVDDAMDGNRKPIDDDCAICCCEMEPDKEAIVWCRAACGNNLHKACFDLWAATKRGAQVTCPYCRTAWQTEGAPSQATGSQAAAKGPKGPEGYVNVAEKFGLSYRRDTSTYGDDWIRKQIKEGNIVPDVPEDDEDAEDDEDDEDHDGY